MKHRLAHY